MPPTPGAVEDFAGARCLVRIGDSVTTDHISPAGSIKPDSPAGRYLIERGVERREFNSYGSRRGNHEVMVRGTFANVRLRNLLVPESEGTWTVHLPSGDELTIFEAAERYRGDDVPLIVLAGKEYGSGSSRDWAAKGPKLLGVRAVIAESYERIHRSNLLMMGVLPLQFRPGESAESLGLTGREEYAVSGIENGEAREVTVRADAAEFRARRQARHPTRARVPAARRDPSLRAARPSRVLIAPPPLRRSSGRDHPRDSPTPRLTSLAGWGRPGEDRRQLGSRPRPCAPTRPERARHGPPVGETSASRCSSSSRGQRSFLRSPSPTRSSPSCSAA